MLQPSGGLGLAPEALDELLVLGEAGMEDLERDPALEVSVVGQPDIGHAARPDPPQDPVPPINNAALSYLGHARPFFWPTGQKREI